MKKLFIFLIFVGLLLNFSGCAKQNNPNSNGLISNVPYKEPANIFATHNPTPKEILDQTPDADIFLYKDVVVQNAKEIEWVQKLKLSKGELIGETVSPYKKGTNFKQGMATKLPTGTKIYKTVENRDILMAEKDGNYIRYLMLLEG